MAIWVKSAKKNTHNIRPGRLLLRFFEPKSFTRENKLSLLGFSQFPMLLLGLLAQRLALAFSRSLTLLCRMRELAIAAAVASLAFCCGDASQIKNDHMLCYVKVLSAQNIVTKEEKSILHDGLRNGHFRSPLLSPQGLSIFFLLTNHLVWSLYSRFIQRRLLCPDMVQQSPDSSSSSSLRGKKLSSRKRCLFVALLWERETRAIVPWSKALLSHALIQKNEHLLTHRGWGNN